MGSSFVPAAHVAFNMNRYPRFTIVRTGNGYTYLLKDEHSNVILSGNLWRSVAMCMHEINEVKLLAGSGGTFVKVKCNDGQHSFMLANKKKESIGHGASWWSSGGRDCAMMVVRREAFAALVENDGAAVAEVFM